MSQRSFEDLPLNLQRRYEVVRHLLEIMTSRRMTYIQSRFNTHVDVQQASEFEECVPALITEATRQMGTHIQLWLRLDAAANLAYQAGWSEPEHIVRDPASRGGERELVARSAARTLAAAIAALWVYDELDGGTHRIFDAQAAIQQLRGAHPIHIHEAALPSMQRYEMAKRIAFGELEDLQEVTRMLIELAAASRAVEAL